MRSQLEVGENVVERVSVDAINRHARFHPLPMLAASLEGPVLRVELLGSQSEV